MCREEVGCFIKDSFQRLAKSCCEEFQWGKGKSKEEGKKRESKTGRRWEGDTKRASVNCLSAGCCATKVGESIYLSLVRLSLKETLCA